MAFHVMGEKAMEAEVDKYIHFSKRNDRHTLRTTLYLFNTASLTLAMLLSVNQLWIG